ncbi:MAG: helix-turn-helix domain-containing protein [bacterium]
MAKKRSLLPVTKELLSTGDVAALCSVTPDTVLKWIRGGKIPATRTPGGHHRIRVRALDTLLDRDMPKPANRSESGFVYCWEFNSDSGFLPDECRSCIVYRSGTQRCYEMSDLPSEAGHARLYCQHSCDDCDYYRMVKGQRPNILVVTDQQQLKTTLEGGTDGTRYNLKVTDCEYRCSMMIEDFRPDYVVIDCSLGTERSREFALLLYEDPRLPLVRVVLVGNGHLLPTECDRLVYALVDHSFTSETLADLVSGVNLKPDRLLPRNEQRD